jgi:hypothetical protein
MNTSKLLPVAALVTMLVGAGAMVATAQTLNDTAGQGPRGQGGMMQADMMQADWGRGDGQGRGHGGRGGHGGHGRGGPMGGMMHEVFAQVDADGDGAVTQAEIDTWRTAQVTAADTSGDGQLSLAEFTPAWAAFMQSRVVDDFQALDNDGDGQITAAEIDARLGGVVERFDQNGDGALSPADRMGRGGHGGNG